MNKIILFAVSISAALASCTALVDAQPAGAIHSDIQYEYRPVLNNESALCKHVTRLLNANFRYLWSWEPLIPGSKDSPYDAGGRNSFSKLPGVSHVPVIAVQLVASKVPSSREFDAIQWREGWIATASSSNASTASASLAPVLVSYLDFDNDGRLDTVMKYGFRRGIEELLLGGPDEALAVFRGARREIGAGESLGQLLNSGPEETRPVQMNGQYLRPFIHMNRTYVMEYEAAFKEQDETEAPQIIAAESMKVTQVSFEGERNEFSRAPTWSEEVLCKFDMNRAR